MEIDEYVTVSEATKVMVKAASMIARLCQDGKLPGAKKIAKTWLIPRESVLSYAPGPRGPKPRKAKLAAERAAILEQAKVTAGMPI